MEKCVKVLFTELVLSTTGWWWWCKLHLPIPIVTAPHCWLKPGLFLSLVLCRWAEANAARVGGETTRTFKLFHSQAEDRPNSYAQHQTLHMTPMSGLFCIFFFKQMLIHNVFSNPSRTNNPPSVFIYICILHFSWRNLSEDSDVTNTGLKMVLLKTPAHSRRYISPCSAHCSSVATHIQQKSKRIHPKQLNNPLYIDFDISFKFFFFGVPCSCDNGDLLMLFITRRLAIKCTKIKNKVVTHLWSTGKYLNMEDFGL